MRIVAFVAAVALTGTPALAADLVNQDGSDHTVLMDILGETTEVTVAAGETKAGVCDICTFQMTEDSEPVLVMEGQKAVIQGGALSVAE
ncbi:hypothetical protein [Roseospirillum parvum]|uniref:Uncharacterized protein n=1 Tax=Roseospirillum parvum TaxID=83401 RepID=A0A1G7TKL6_9PROT|nr:hypothetical protein [Roseospirillum parvum]SDG35877.1 hypothetical protein SAMN05421742_10128 [Roseospirillum parvum]